MSKKTNIQYLRELISDNDEAIEWLDAIQDELDESIKDNRYAEERITELRNQLEEYKTGEGLANQINTGMETLYWDCNNIAIEGLMEDFGDKLFKVGHIKVHEAISAL